MANALDLLDQMTQWLEIAGGYRQRAVDRGWSPEAAERMAVDLHAAMVARAMTDGPRDVRPVG